MLDDFFLNGVDKQVFIHNGLKYEFFFKIDPPVNNPSPGVRSLYDYIEMIKKKIIPNYLFNSKAVARASRMRIRNVSKSQKVFIQNHLFEKGFLQRLDRDDSGLPQLVVEVYENFKQANIPKKPNHDPVLNFILRKDKRAIAIELPVWMAGESAGRRMTGHIDLVEIIHQEESDVFDIRVCDYKPEGEKKFLFPIPQISLYALMLKNKLKLGEKTRVTCAIFDKKVVWEFKPEIIYEIDSILKRYNIDREWATFL
ncbi:MAG: PD-(D/E)XK nuclease family protein [Candidatus Helarchaeales archaeon]